MRNLIDKCKNHPMVMQVFFFLFFPTPEYFTLHDLMLIDMRGSGLSRSIYCVRLFHFFIAYPIHSCLLLFIIYLQIMDVVLYFKIRSRSSLDSDIKDSNQTNANLFSSDDGHIFDSLPVKKIMVGQTTQYFRSPLAECLESRFHFTTSFPLISANSISLTHCFLSLISVKFFSSESLSRRRIGVFIFELRSFLDCLDGVVFRAHAKTQRYKSYYGDLGYYVDALSDILGGICLVIGCLLYFYKHRPLRTLVATRRVSPTNEEEMDSMILNLEDEPKVTASNEVVESKQRIYIVLCLFALRYSLAAMFWDRGVRGYEQLLDSSVKNTQESALQLSILHSPLTILIFYLWRYLSAISLQDYLLLSIFFDRTWEFIQKSSLIGWMSLLITILLTELHLDQIRSIFSAL